MALLAYPNVSEGRRPEIVAGIAAAFGPGLLDVHRDPDHHRAAFTLTGAPGALAGAVLDGARGALGLLELDAHDGVHPRVGVIDVAPIVWIAASDRGAACAEALVLADRLGSELGVPVLLYGALARGRTRAELRRGGPAALAARIAAGELTPDFGPGRVDARVGVTLVAARPPLVAFNVVLAPPAGLVEARQVAAAIREGGADGLPGVRAIGVWLESRGRAQVSTNVEAPEQTPLARVLDAIARRLPIVEAELVGLAPAAAFAGFPAEVTLRGRASIEAALAAHAPSD